MAEDTVFFWKGECPQNGDGPRSNHGSGNGSCPTKDLWGRQGRGFPFTFVFLIPSSAEEPETLTSDEERDRFNWKGM